MNLQEALAKITGVTERLEKLTAENSTAQADLQAARTQISNLEAKLKDAPSAEKVTELEGKVTTLTGERDTEKTRADKAEADFTAYKETEPQRFNAELAKVHGQGYKGQLPTAGGDGANQSHNAATVTRAQLNAMTPAARMKHFKSGGKLAD